MSTVPHAGTGPTCSPSSGLARRPAAVSSASCEPARWPRSRSAGCSSAGRAATPNLHAGRRRRRSGGPPTGRRRRSPAWSGRWRATCSSSSRRWPKADPGTASPAPASSGSGTTCFAAPACVSRRRAWHRRISSWPCSSARSRASRTPPASARRPTNVALGGPLRPAREPPRPGRGRPARPRRVTPPRDRVVGSVNLDLVARVRPAAAARGDRLRRHVRPLSRRQGREPGGRVRAARRGSPLIGAVGRDAGRDEALAGFARRTSDSSSPSPRDRRAWR